MTAFADLTQQDLDVRLQLINCCIGEKTADLLAKIKIGAKTVPCKLQELQIMQEMIEILKCYDVTLEEILPFGTIDISNTDQDATINILINGISISGTYTTTSSTPSTEMIALTAIINNYQDAYIATYNVANHLIEIQSTTCTNGNITITQTGKISILVTDLSEGVCLTDNCITEEQVQAMFNWMAKKCGICFQLPGFNYE